MISNIVESFRLAMQALTHNKMRSFLSSLGVLIGISTVILMGWLLTGLNSVVNDTFNSIGVDMLYIDKFEWAGGMKWDDMRKRKDITESQINNFMEYPTYAEAIIPQLDMWAGVMKYKGEKYSGLPFVGTTSKFAITSSGVIENGRFFNDNEDRDGAKVIIMGTKSFETVFPKHDGLGKFVTLEGKKFQVIGCLKKQGTFLFDMMDNRCYIPLKAYKNLYGSLGSYTLAIKAGSEKNMDLVRDQIRGNMRSARNIKPGAPDDFSINESKAFSNSIDTIRNVVGTVGYGITFLSFFVGIIGIMNIMFVTVTERTREIGIRKAVGAKRNSILFQFLFESAALCFMGALLSFVFCQILVYAASSILPKYIESLSFLKPYLPLNLLLIATVVSILVGVVAGLLPALRASKLDPVDALRYE
jgi:putative ABC transport system permease protein